MKKLFTLFALLGAMFCAQQASAASYNLWIAGTQVTDANKSNLTGLTSKGSISGGTITFNSSTNVLTIPAGVTIQAEGAYGIEVGAINLTIQLGNGSVKIISNHKDYNAIRMTSTGYTLTIKGNNSASNGDTKSGLALTAGANKSGLYTHNKCTTTIDGVWLTSSGGKWGLDGPTSSNGEKLIIKGWSRVGVSGTEAGIADITNFELQDNMEIVSPSGGYFSNRKVLNASGNAATSVQINHATTLYNLYICGIRLNNLNANYIGTKLKAAGYLTSAANTVTFSATDKKLSFNGATLKASHTHIIFHGKYSSDESGSYFDGGLTMEFAGTNNLQQTGSSAAMNLWRNTTMQGTGTVNITASGWDAIMTSGGSTTTITGGLTMNATGTGGIHGYKDTSDKLVINNASVNIKATAGMVCHTFKGGIELTNCDIVSPSGQHVHYATNTDYPGYYIGPNGSYSSNATVVIKNGATSYGFAILGRYINSNNYQNISWQGITGTVSYNPTTAVLTLKGATITKSSGNENGITYYSNYGLKNIYLVGNNTIETSNAGICFATAAQNGTYSITGDTLTVKSTGGMGMYVQTSNVDLTVQCKKLDVQGKTYGIYDSQNDLKLTLTKHASAGSIYYFYGPDSGSMVGIASLTMNTMDFDPTMYSSTEGAYFDDTSKRVKLITGDVAKGTIKFRNPSTYYNIKIAGKQLNDCNRDGFGSKYITASKKRAVKYDPNTNTLTLDGATITNGTTVGNTHGAGNPIDCWIPNLTINTPNASTIQTTDGYYYPLFVGANTTITGSGKLTIKGHSNTVRAYNTPTITFKDANVSISGSIDTSGNSSKIGGVVVDNSTVTIGNQIYQANSVTWKNGSVLLKPQGGSYDATAGYMKLANGNAAYGIEFGKLVSYGLSIDGTEVTNANNTDPKGDGSFSYDPNTKTLSVKKSYTAKTSANLIQNNTVDGLVINFTANATLTTTVNVIKTAKSATVKRSNSSIKVILNGNTSDSYVGIWLNGTGTLTIDNMDMTINSGTGIYGNGTGSILNLQKSAIVINAQYSSCLNNFENITGNDCGPVFPAGSKFSNGRAVDQDGKLLTKTTLIINLEGTGIEAVVADDFDGTEVEGVDNAEGIYDLNGRRLNELQRGVNIVRRRDGSTVKVVKK